MLFGADAGRQEKRDFRSAHDRDADRDWKGRTGIAFSTPSKTAGAVYGLGRGGLKIARIDGRRVGMWTIERGTAPRSDMEARLELLGRTYVVEPEIFGSPVNQGSDMATRPGRL